MKPLAKPDSISKWACERCGALHDYEDSAVECCPNLVVQIWLCGTCKEEYGSRDSADECCEEQFPEPDLTEQVIRQDLSAEELEALGQLRLIP